MELPPTDLSPFFAHRTSFTVAHPEAETLCFVMVEASSDLHAAAKRCTGFRNKVSPLVSPKTDICALDG